jgi:hypothetical protein
LPELRSSQSPTALANSTANTDRERSVEKTMFGGCCCSTGLTLDEQIAEAELMKGEQAEKTVLLRRVKTRPPPVPALNGAMDLNGT